MDECSLGFGCEVAEFERKKKRSAATKVPRLSLNQEDIPENLPQGTNLAFVPKTPEEEHGLAVRDSSRYKLTLDTDQQLETLQSPIYKLMQDIRHSWV